MKDRWDANLYDNSHSFVNQMAGGLLDLLDPKPGQRILDLGCGTGPLTEQIARRGAQVIGIDASANMIAKARVNFPSLSFEVMDALNLSFAQPFDAIFSNAVLHWVQPPETAILNMHRALKPGGRLVLEMGGKGNVATILAAASHAGRSMGLSLATVLDINYFPSLGQYTSLLEQAGFTVNFAALFDRPTPLEDGEAGLIKWIQMFRPGVLEIVPAHYHQEFATFLAQKCRARLFCDGRWYADYRRLRVIATRP